MKMFNSMRMALYTVVILVMAGCGGPSKESASEKGAPADGDTAIRLKQYTVQGKQLYQTYCVSCHQSEGQGLARLYPPLAGSDYLLENLPRAACMIRNGKSEEIVVNGQKYNQMMPGFSNLTPLEIAEILTYITNDWGNEKGLSSVKKVEDWLKECEGGL